MILAREAKTAVIFRRGPSKWTQLIQWDTQSDSFTYGHWFKGRIYERRCDLSPDGKLLLYFVSKHTHQQNQETYTTAWTAISKLPWLTALTLWPKGDTWGGGGHFVDAKTVALDHGMNQLQTHVKHPAPRWLKVLPNKITSEQDKELYTMGLTRAGWRFAQEGHETLQPEVRVLDHPKRPFRLIMERSSEGYSQVERFAVHDLAAKTTLSLEDADCARWDQRGRLVFIRAGKLFAGFVAEGELSAKELADFNGQQPQELDSPAWAKRWE